MFTVEAEIAPDSPTQDSNPNNNSGMAQDTTAVSGLTDIKMTSITVDMPAAAPSGQPFTVDVYATVHNNYPLTTTEVIVNVGVGVPPDCTSDPTGWVSFGTTPIDLSVDLVVAKSWQVTCDDAGQHVIIGCAAAIITELHVQDPNGLNNGAGGQGSMLIDGSSDPAGQRARAVPGDPAEICDDGIDNDGDTFVDEEPDLDGDGLTDCVDTDDDGDGFADDVESFVGTDTLNACPRGPFDSAWPVDFNNDRAINIVDVLSIRPTFGSSQGDASYVPRKDLNADSVINILDVLAIKPYFGSGCS